MQIFFGQRFAPRSKAVKQELTVVMTTTGRRLILTFLFNLFENKTILKKRDAAEEEREMDSIPLKISINQKIFHATPSMDNR